MKSVPRWTSIAVCLLATVSTIGLAGCGGGGRDEETVSIDGKVTFNGGPVPAGSVLVLESKDVGASRTATLSAEGTYTLSGTAALPVGTYKVAITPPNSGQAVDTSGANYDEMMSGNSQPKNENEEGFPVPQKFRSTTTTDKTVDITSGESTYDIDFSG